MIALVLTCLALSIEGRAHNDGAPPEAALATFLFSQYLHARSASVRQLRRPHSQKALDRHPILRCSTRGDQDDTIRSDLQKKTWLFLKSRRLAGDGKEVKSRRKNKGGERGKQRIIYGPEEAEEKRRLKRKLLVDQELPRQEQQRLDELKELNKEKKIKEEKALGPAMRKLPVAFQACNISGSIDSMNERFPQSSCGTDWILSKGKSRGELLRATLQNRTCNILRVKASLLSVHLSLDLSNEELPDLGTIDASAFEGIKFDVFSPRSESNSLLLMSRGYGESKSNYRATFNTTALQFTTVCLPWSAFVSEEASPQSIPLDLTRLRRLSFELGGSGEMEELALSEIRLYKVSGC